MCIDKRPPDTPEPDYDPASLLDTFFDAVIFLDRTATILSANEQAAAIARTNKNTLPGRSLWQAVPQLISTTLYQAITHTARTDTPFQVTYFSPVTGTYFHVYLCPTSEGIALFLHEETQSPTALQVIAPQDQKGHLEAADNLPEWVVILTPEGLLLEINQRPLAETGVRREEVLGKPFVQFPAWAAASLAHKQLLAALARASQGNIVRFEARLYPQAEYALDMAVTLTPHFDAHQQVEYLILSCRDITERKQTEEELRSLVDTIPQLVWITRADGYLTYNNQRLINYLAITLEDVEGLGWVKYLHPDDRQRAMDIWQAAINRGESYETEYRLRDGTTGAYRWFLVRGMPQRDAQGTIHSWIGTCTDIDEQKQTRERIKASEQKFRVLAEAIPHYVWTLLPNGSLDYTNQSYQRYCDIAQLNHYNIWEMSWYRFVHPDDLEHTLFRRKQAFNTGETYENEYRLKDPQTGEYRWYLVRANPMRDDDDQIIKWFVTATDINEQKQTEEALRQSQQQMQTLMSSSIIGFFISEEQQIFEANDAFLHMTGYDRDDLQSGRLNWHRMTPPEYHAVTEQSYNQMASEPLPPYEKVYIGKDGSQRLPVLVGASMIQENPLQAICFVLDNSARKELEQRKDTFINMVSHELKTPLTVLKIQIQLLKRRLNKQGHHQAVATFLKVEEPIQRLERLIAELLDISKMQTGKLDFIWEPVDLSALLQEVVETMQHTYTSHTIEVSETTPTVVMGDKGRLEQVLFNLLSNAIKFSPIARTVELTLRSTPENAIITVRDHGTGIAPEHHKKIFERFYQSSNTQKGTIPGLGMGLYIVEEVVKQHHGTITLESEVGKGSTFQVTLPLKQER